MVPIAPSTTWTRPSASRSLRVRTLALVIEVGGEPALRGGDVHPLPPGIVLDLVALDLADPEVLGLRMPEVVAADRRRRIHGKALGQRDARVRFGAEQVEQQPLLRVIRTGRVARCRTNALVALVNE